MRVHRGIGVDGDLDEEDDDKDLPDGQDVILASRNNLNISVEYHIVDAARAYLSRVLRIEAIKQAQLTTSAK
jgi:hypothetical protein